MRLKDIAGWLADRKLGEINDPENVKSNFVGISFCYGEKIMSLTEKIRWRVSISIGNFACFTMPKIIDKIERLEVIIEPKNSVDSEVDEMFSRYLK